MASITHDETAALERRSVCLTCPNAAYCATLSVCLEFAQSLAMTAGDAGHRERLSGLRSRLEQLRYRYPDGEEMCDLPVGEASIMVYVEEALDLVQAIHRDA